MVGLFAIFLIAIFAFGFVATSTVQTVVEVPKNITIVIDAGHGGADGGTIGTTTGIIESELNLVYAKKLTKYLEGFGIDVINTRNSGDGLYSTFDDDYKLVDMKKRAEIINKSGAQILISIHMNKYTSSVENGAQVFFEQGNQDSENLANSIRDILVANFDNARQLTLAGDYYILNETNQADFENWLSRNIIPITIDQRYGKEDLEYINSIIRGK